MSIVLVTSIILRFLAVAVSLEAMRRLKDWRIGLLALMAALMALRQILTLSSRPVEFSLQMPTNLNELPGLLVSILVLVAVVFLYRLLRDRGAAHQELAAQQAQLRLVTDSLPVLLAFIDRDLVLRYANERHEDWFEMPVADMVGRPIRDVIGDAAVFAACEPYMRRALQGETVEYEVKEPFPDGNRRLLHVRYLPYREADGTVCGFSALVEDVTEKRQLAEQLAHSQRLQAIGQLTGGVAHDFNNLLAVIQGNAEFLGDDLHDSEHLDAIGRASARGVEMTQRLLAFSRQQPLRPKIVDLSETVAGMEDLLRRTLGEDIEVRVSAAPDLDLAVADPGQVENALLNLALNARDAMPGGGILTIECANAHLDDAYVAANPDAHVGNFVVISVSDTGTGIAPDLIDRVFEPFFSTKEVGQGSGLGLSMVYGFAQQSHGHAKLYSELGVGTTARLYLPCSESASMAEAGTLERKELPRGQGEVILVLEDDAEVRALAVTLLTGLGYSVLEAADAHHAEAVFSAAERVDVVLSDVVLPGGLSGPDFVEKALKLRPGTKALFMSGYTAAATRNNKLLEEGAMLLNKPFRRADLAEAIRSILTN